MLPRQFLVKTVLGALRRNQNVPVEILASRIADQIEISADVFESNDDPVAVPLARIREIYPSTSPSSPEDLGQVPDQRAARAARAVEGLPQPELGGAPKPLIIMPDSTEFRDAFEAVNGTQRNPQGEVIRPIRVTRPSKDSVNRGEEKQWDFQELYAELMGVAPFTFDVTPLGTKGTVTLDRSFQADASTEVIKVIYTLAGQRESSPSTAADAQTTAITIPIEVSASFSTYSPRDIDFAGTIAGLKASAARSFAPRSSVITSSTPRTAVSLDNIYRQAMREGARSGPAGAPESSTWANAAIDLT